MIIYTEEDKELVIPKGIGNFGDGGDYQQGYENGVRDQKAKLASETFTSNGSFSRNDGWNHILINVNSGSCEGVYEMGFADGHASGVTDGYAQGYPAGEAAQREKLVSTAVTANGTYTRVDGFNSVEVNIPTGCNLESKTVVLDSMIQTISVDTERPVVPGQTVYGGNITDFKNKMGEYFDSIRVYTWDNPEHSDRAEAGIFMTKDGEYGFRATQMEQATFFAFKDLTASWVFVNQYMYLCTIGDNTYFYNNAPYGFVMKAGGWEGPEVTPEEMLFSVIAYDGMSAVTVNAEKIYASGYSAGTADVYKEGWLDGIFSTSRMVSDSPCKTGTDYFGNTGIPQTALTINAAMIQSTPHLSTSGSLTINSDVTVANLMPIFESNYHLIADYLTLYNSTWPEGMNLSTLYIQSGPDTIIPSGDYGFTEWQTMSDGNGGFVSIGGTDVIIQLWNITLITINSQRMIFE